jgi:predicted SAM-dependent methyltransferase
MKSLNPIHSQSFLTRYRPKLQQANHEVKAIYGKSIRQFFRPPFPKLGNGDINLHLGCGTVNHPKFINIDGLPAPHIHYIRAIDNLAIFKDNSVALIYACHCLEHFPHATVPKVLGEWFRTLKKDGILRLSVPNFDVLLDIYQESGNEINSIILPLMGGQYYKYDFHMTVFNQSSLERLLREVGFSKVREWQPGSSELTTFEDWSNCKVYTKGKYCLISLNLEAVK